MAPRANWKGYLKVGELNCQVALYTAASTSDRVSLHILNRKTGHRVHRQYIDADTGRELDDDQIVKGYEMADGRYVVLEPDEIKSAVPDSNKTLALDAFIPCEEIDTIFLDRPYYLAPVNQAASDIYELIRAGLQQQNVAALSRTVLFRRLRTLLIRPGDQGLIATTKCRRQKKPLRISRHSRLTVKCLNLQNTSLQQRKAASTRPNSMTVMKLPFPN